MAPLVLYAAPPSPPSRSVVLLLKLLKVDFEYKNIDVMGGENKTPEFLALNPQHNVPLLKDGKFLLNESKAILMYLANCYDREGKYYPKVR